MTLNDSLFNFYKPAYLRGLHAYKGKDYSCDLEISDLLCQTSGWADIYKEGKNSIKKQAVIANTFITFDENIALTKEKEAHFPPDYKSNAYYDDINYNILGDIIEKVIKCPLERLFEKYIFTKIKMTKTYLPVSEKDYIPMVYYGDKQLYRRLFRNNAIGIWVLAGESIEEWLKINRKRSFLLGLLRFGGVHDGGW